MLLVSWRGPDPLHGGNLLRRVILEHYAPRLDGQVAAPPITQNTWFVYNSGNDVTEQNQLEIIRSMAPLGVEAYWLDAGWFEGGWPSGVGSWVPRADAFPRGLRPLGEAAHKLGMKFVVWFEPERVSPNSRIGKEHPEWVLHAGAGDGLFNLGDPPGRKWLTDLLSKVIGESGIDVYRNDFNIDPLPFWRAADAADRQGLAEIRYVEGLYEMWDELRRRHAGLLVDNCASGGRRIDLETVSRSLPLWRSDSQCCGRAMPVQDQAQTAGLSLYVPLHSAGCWGFDPYTFRSVATTGLNVCVDTRAKDFPAGLAKAAIAEAKALRPFYLGDYYPLLAISADERHWCGWQFDRPDLGGGFAVVFRRSGSPYLAADVALRGVESDGTYDVSFAEGYDVRQTKRMTGAELTRLRVTLDTAPSCVLIRYQKTK
jgi:alpha-galactosidase